MDALLIDIQRRHRRDCWWCLILGPSLVFAVLCLSGCGSSEPQFLGRVGVSGEVTLDGQPLEAGIIEFLPARNAPGPRAMAEIKEGKFMLDKDHGPIAGSMRVQITAGQNEYEPPTDGQRPKPFTREPIPARYNRYSTLSTDVKADGENVFQFPLKTR
jgi:hypothetical protein